MIYAGYARKIFVRWYPEGIDSILRPLTCLHNLRRSSNSLKSDPPYEVLSNDWIWLLSINPRPFSNSKSDQRRRHTAIQMQLRITPKTWTQIEEQNDAGAARILRICILLLLSFLNFWVSKSPTLMFLYFKQLPQIFQHISVFIQVEDGDK